MFDLPPPDPGIEISVASRGMSKGLSQTDGHQLVIRPELGFGPVFFGVQYRNLSSPSADGELWAMAGLRGQAAGLDLSTGITFKRWIGTRGRPDREAVELIASASRALGPVTPRLTVHYSPDDLGSGRASFYTEAGATVRIAAGTNVFANASRRERAGGADYFAFNAGVSHVLLSHVTAELRYYDTNRGAIDETYRGRLVAALRVQF